MIYLYGYTIFERFDGFDVLDISDGFKVGLSRLRKVLPN